MESNIARRAYLTRLVIAVGPFVMMPLVLINVMAKIVELNHCHRRLVVAFAVYCYCDNVSSVNFGVVVGRQAVVSCRCFQRCVCVDALRPMPPSRVSRISNSSRDCCIAHCSGT